MHFRTLAALLALVALVLTPALTLAQTAVPADIHGRLNSSGPTPTLSTCGTAPAIEGSDSAFKITIGTGTPSACTVTFVKAFTVAPACLLVDATTAAANMARPTTVSTTAVTFTMAAATVNGDVLYGVCIGR